jgi:hypothetical protein
MSNPQNKGISTLVGIIIILLVVIILGGGVYLWQQKNFSNETAEPVPNDFEGWQTYTNSQYGFEFKYPENFGANVWRPFFWPPTTTVVSISEDPIAKGCPNFPGGLPSGYAGTQETVRINNIDYILYKASDGAAGSSYDSYCYVTKKDQNYYVISFVIRTTNGCGQNCGPYCGTQYEQECLNFSLLKDVETPIKNIVSTFKFIQ